MAISQYFLFNLDIIVFVSYCHSILQAEVKKKFEEYLQVQLKCFEKFLEENGGNGHFVGDSVSSVSHYFFLMC